MMALDPFPLHHALPFERQFKLSKDILHNKTFARTQQNEKSTLLNQAITLLTESAKKGLQPTTNVIDALMQSGIAYDKEKIKKTSLLWEYITHKQIYNAASSLFLSATSFWKDTTENKHLDNTAQTILDQDKSHVTTPH